MDAKIDSNTYALLLSARKEVSLYHTEPCNLVHEKVTGVQEGLFIEDESPARYSFLRVGFCNAEIRKFRLNCAHTMAASGFSYLLARLENTGLFGTGQLDASHLKQVLSEIYLLDHRKGEIEKQLALCIYTKAEKIETPHLNSVLNEVKEKHRKLVESIAQIYKTIVAEIDSVILQVEAEGGCRTEQKS